MSNYFTSFKLDKSDIYFFIIMCFITYILYKELTRKEAFGTTDDINNAINGIYSADIEALRNLSGMAAKLMSNNNLTFPGILTVTNNIVGSKDLTISGNITGNNNLTVTNNIVGQKDLTIRGNMTISGKINNDIKITNNMIEFGLNDTGKEGNAGKIGYGNFGEDNLAIIGKGTTGTNRKVKLWDNLEVNGYITCQSIKIGNWLIDIKPGDELQFNNPVTGKGVLFGNNSQIYISGRAI